MQKNFTLYEFLLNENKIFTSKESTQFQVCFAKKFPSSYIVIFQNSEEKHSRTSRSKVFLVQIQRNKFSAQVYGVDLRVYCASSTYIRLYHLPQSHCYHEQPFSKHIAM